MPTKRYLAKIRRQNVLRRQALPVGKERMRRDPKIRSLIKDTQTRLLKAVERIEHWSRECDRSKDEKERRIALSKMHRAQKRFSELKADVIDTLVSWGANRAVQTLAILGARGDKPRVHMSDILAVLRNASKSPQKRVLPPLPYSAPPLPY